MTAVPQPWAHLLTVGEYAELGEIESGYTELLEGRLLMSPSPVPDHNVAAAELLVLLRPQLPDHLEVIPDVEGGLIRAGEVLVVVEVVSPGSHRTDYVTKRSEYADAGIQHYWIVDLDKPVSLVDCHLAEGFGYQDRGSITDFFTTTEPFPIRLPLDRLL